MKTKRYVVEVHIHPDVFVRRFMELMGAQRCFDRSIKAMEATNRACVHDVRLWDLEQGKLLSKAGNN